MIFAELQPEAGRSFIAWTKEQNSMRTVMHNTHLPVGWLTTHVNQQGKMAVLQSIAHVLDKLWLPLTLDAHLAHGFMIALLRPIAFSIGAGSDDIMIYVPFP